MNKKVISRIVLLALALAMAVFCVQCGGTTATEATATPTVVATPKPIITAAPVRQGAFDLSDLTGCAIYPGMTAKDVRERLDKWTTDEETTDAITGGKILVYHYVERGMDMDMEFTESDDGNTTSLRAIDARTDRLIGPREFKFGDSMDVILAAFAPDTTAYQVVSDSLTILYAAEVSGENALPPYGIKTTTADAITLTFVAPVDGEFTSGTTIDSYKTQDCVLLEYTIDPTTETVTAIHWYVGPLA